eukprot:Em0011g1174a
MMRHRGVISATRIGTHGPATLDTSSKVKTLPDVFTVACIVLTLCLLGTSYHFYRWLPEPVAPSSSNQFSAARARRHMEDLVSLGVRNVGSQANEIHAKNLLIQKVRAIQATASKELEVELSVQATSGGYYLDFLGGMTHIYHNVSNVIVKVSKRASSSEHAFLINAHYDSSLGAVSASDDAVSCGTMLEALQILTSEPVPMVPEHDIIFLFNGAEETVLQASHGFVTQHPWAKRVKAFVNLEAAGAGGREIVFQSGPENPWLISIYAKVAPYPYGSVVAEDLFQSGLIPSDTDFRIFRDFGHLPGIDTAYYSNGYVYHTEYDIPSAIPDACIQRAGDNLVALVKGVANSPFLAHPGDYKHGKVVFFDFLGLFMVVYPERVGLILNTAVVLVSLCYLYVEVRWSRFSYMLIGAGLVVTLLSWLAAVCVTLVTALGLSLIGRSMSCTFSDGQHSSLLATQEKASFLGTLVMWTVLLAVFTALRVPSAFVCVLWVLPPLLSRLLLWEVAQHRLLPPHLAFVLSTVVGVAIPSMLLLQLDAGMAEIFIPITGRSGTVLPPEIPIGLLCVVALFITVPYVSATRQSDVFVIAFDYLELDILAEAAPLYRQAREVECQGAYCGLPYYFPVLHFFNTHAHMARLVIGAQWHVLLIVATLRSGWASCRMVAPSYTLPGSCAAAGIGTCCSGDSCDGTGGCQCDSSCFDYGDCCSDILVTCPRYLAPTNVTVYNVSQSDAAVRWSMQYVTPNLVFQAKYFSPSLPDSNRSLSVTPSVEDCTYSIDITGLQPSTMYVIRIITIQSDERSISEHVNFTTNGHLGDVAAIQLRAGPFVSCKDWDEQIKADIHSFFRTNLVQVLGNVCKCAYTPTLLSAGIVACMDVKPQHTYGVYRTTVMGTH